jgi:hypothetical protein
MRKTITGAVLALALALTACAPPSQAGGADPKTTPAGSEEDAPRPIQGPEGVVDSHRGNHLVIVPFDEVDGGVQEILANRAQRKACLPLSRFPDCLP